MLDIIRMVAWLFGLTVAIGAVILILIALARELLWRRRRRRATEAALRRRFAPDGTPYPPFGRGMCEACEQPFEEVFFLPGGRRLCRACGRKEGINLPDEE